MNNLSIIPSTPSMTIDMAMAIMNVPLLVYGEVGEDVLLLETSFEVDNQKIDGHLFLMPTVESLSTLKKVKTVLFRFHTLGCQFL